MTSGDVGDLLPLVFDELRALAAHYLRGERPDHTLQPTALVNEAWLRLQSETARRFNDRNHFIAIAALTMRRVLVDHARTRNAERRGGGATRITLGHAAGATAPEASVDLLALDAALEELAALHEQHARIVELRYFGGLETKEIAEVLECSERTVERGWTFARAWLLHRLGAGA